MRTIHKHHVGGGVLWLALPRRWKLLHFGMQSGAAHIWVELDPDEPRANNVRFQIYPTGATIEDDSMYHQATCFDGPFVWHLYAKEER